MRCVHLSPALRRCGPCGRIALLLLSGLSLSLVESGAVFAQPATAGQQQIGHPFAAYVAEAARRFRIPEHWIVAVMGAESAGATRAVSSAGAMGLMQVMPDTWDHLRARYRLGRDPFDPRDNILAGAAYLREMYDRYGAIPAMLAAYNAGPARYDEYLATGRPLPAETRAYVDLLAPALDAAAPSPNAPGASPSPPDWREAPLFVPRSNDHRTVDNRASEEPSKTSHSPVPEEREPNQRPQSESVFVAHGSMRGPS